VSLQQATQAAGDLGVRFNLVGVLPTTLLVTWVAALVASGAPSSSPDGSELIDHLEALSGTDLVLLGAAVIVVALILQPLQLALVRLLEGYWGRGALGRGLSRPLVERHRRRRHVLTRASTAEGAAPEGDTAVAMADAAQRLRRRYPPEPVPLLPSALGNVLRAAEYRAGRPYGLDAVLAWPRLYPLLAPSVRAMVDDLRLQLDLAARFTAMFVLAAVASAALLATHGWWLLVPAGALLLALVSYRGAVAAAGAYGGAVEVAFDLTHLELRKALHLGRPPDRDAERAANRALTDFFAGIPTPLEYEAD
jgi:hypothetical protein